MNDNSIWILMTIVGVACTLFCSFNLRSSYQALRAALPDFIVPQLSFRYSPAQVQSQVESMDKTFLQTLRQFSKHMSDTLVGVWMLLMVVSRNCTTLQWLMLGMMGAATLAFLFGVLETMFVRRAHFRLARACSVLKWGLFALWTAGMFAGLFIRSTVY